MSRDDIVGKRFGRKYRISDSSLRVRVWKGSDFIDTIEDLIETGEVYNEC